MKTLFQLLFALLLLLSAAATNAQCFTPEIPCVQYETGVDGLPKLVNNTERLLDYIARNLTPGGGGGAIVTVTNPFNLEATQQLVLDGITETVDGVTETVDGIADITCTKFGPPVGLCDLNAELQAINATTVNTDNTTTDILTNGQYEASRNATYHNDYSVAGSGTATQTIDAALDPESHWTAIRSFSVAVTAPSGAEVVVSVFSKSGITYVRKAQYTLDATTNFLDVPSCVADRITIELTGAGFGATAGITYSLTNLGSWPSEAPVASGDTAICSICDVTTTLETISDGVTINQLNQTMQNVALEETQLLVYNETQNITSTVQSVRDRLIAGSGEQSVFKDDNDLSVFIDTDNGIQSVFNAKSQTGNPAAVFTDDGGYSVFKDPADDHSYLSDIAQHLNRLLVAQATVREPAYVFAGLNDQKEVTLPPDPVTGEPTPIMHVQAFGFCDVGMTFTITLYARSFSAGTCNTTNWEILGTISNAANSSVKSFETKGAVNVIAVLTAWNSVGTPGVELVYTGK